MLRLTADPRKRIPLSIKEPSPDPTRKTEDTIPAKELVKRMITKVIQREKFRMGISGLSVSFISVPFLETVRIRRGRLP